MAQEAPHSPQDPAVVAPQIGIVGLPNVGKSTLFNTLTKCSIPAENFPFCTIEPNEVKPPSPPLADSPSFRQPPSPTFPLVSSAAFVGFSPVHFLLPTGIGWN